MRATKVLSDRSPTNGYFPWYPVFEGEWSGSWLNLRPSDRLVRGTYSRIPVVLGSVVDEGTRCVLRECDVDPADVVSLTDSRVRMLLLSKTSRIVCEVSSAETLPRLLG